MWTRSCLTSLCFVLLELLVDGGDGVQQDFDLLNARKTNSVSLDQYQIPEHLLPVLSSLIYSSIFWSHLI